MSVVDWSVGVVKYDCNLDGMIDYMYVMMNLGGVLVVIMNVVVGELLVISMDVVNGL